MSVVERLAEKLDLSIDEADRLLDQFVDNVRQRLREDGEVDLPGIGTFRQSPDGEIEFAATPSLAAVANYRYGGLSPVKIPGDAAHETDLSSEDSELPAGAAENRETGSPDDGIPQEDVQAQETDGDDLETSSDEIDEDVEQFWEEERTQSPLGSLPDETYEDTSYSVVDSDAGEEVSNDRGETSDAPSTGETNADSPTKEEMADRDTREEQVEETQGGTQPAYPRKRPSPRSTSRGTLTIVATVLIAAGAALLLYYAWSGDNVPISSSSPSTEQTSSESPTADEGTGPGDTEAASSPSSADDGPSGDGASKTLPFDTPLESEDGLIPEHGGYTWVVASLADQSAAEELREAYAADGFRTSVFRGGNGYRVAVGQFETREAALDTRDQLPSDVASAAWIMEIQSNMSPSVSS
jgi:hypothetical protein